jgi:hypothetical protein
LKHTEEIFIQIQKDVGNDKVTDRRYSWEHTFAEISIGVLCTCAQSIRTYICEGAGNVSSSPCGRPWQTATGFNDGRPVATLPMPNAFFPYLVLLSG